MKELVIFKIGNSQSVTLFKDGPSCIYSLLELVLFKVGPFQKLLFCLINPRQDWSLFKSCRRLLIILARYNRVSLSGGLAA